MFDYCIKLNYYHIGGDILKIETTIKEACTTGFWSCLQPTDWIQVMSVAIAMVAGIAAWKSAAASKEASKVAEKQLSIINMQRIDSVRPELFIKNEKYTLRYYIKIGIGFFTKIQKIHVMIKH